MRYVQPYGIADLNGSYINGNPALGIEGSIPPAEAFEHPMREMDSIIAKSGIIPDGADLLQMTKAVRSQAINFATDTGAANNMVVVFDPPFVGLTAGLPIRVQAHVANTGATTIIVDSNSPRPVVRANGAALVADDIFAGAMLDLIYDGTRFQIANYRGSGTGGGDVNNYAVDIPYTADIGTVASAIIANFLPPQIAPVAGDAILVKIANANLGATPTTIVISGLPVRSVINPNGSELTDNQIVPGHVAFLLYDGAKFQLTNPAKAIGGAIGTVLIARRAMGQDFVDHWTSVQAPSFVEACRFTYSPVAAGNKALFDISGSLGSGSGSSYTNKRDAWAVVQWSKDGGTVWEPPWTGIPTGTIAGFMRTLAMTAWESGQNVVTERDEFFRLYGELTIPTPLPAQITFRVIYACGSGNTPDAHIWPGTLFHVTEYTG